ncbi:hypothetical protein E2C01_071884 [Portunus trituberculatus]|uniref:Uncharacterized protein n=1 Tax=Portunus trituberculatus TaxID=210409 RepID=A0A5B7HWG2_PORTR|nr:hypothetical protein [Portunus trituberculatus]
MSVCEATERSNKEETPSTPAAAATTRASAIQQLQQQASDTPQQGPRTHHSGKRILSREQESTIGFFHTEQWVFSCVKGLSHRKEACAIVMQRPR